MRFPSIGRHPLTAAWIAIGLGALSGPAAATVAPLHDFRDISVWRDNADGGVPVIRSSAEGPSPGMPAMKLVYRERAPGWGNSVGPCSVPANATALRFRIRVHAAEPQAATHVWLQEPDGDAWLQQVVIAGAPVGQAKPGWHEVVLPVIRFTFEPRGPGSRSMTSVTRMLLGCNYGNLEVSVSDMCWVTTDAPQVAPLPRCASCEPEAGKRGSVAILDMTPLPTGAPGGTSPRALAVALRSVGYGATVLRAGDLADPAVLTPARFDAVALPCGRLFPLAARDTFLGYLRAGGSFLSTGGYAFDRLVEWTGTQWVDAGVATTAEAMASPGTEAATMNTRTGKPGDAMSFALDQIGVFDPAFELRGAAALRVAPLYAPGGARSAALPAKGSITGFAASGLIGANNPVFPPVYRRWIPVVDTIDRQGRPSGAALAIMHNYTGVFRGSSWAFSGLTGGQDLLTGTPARTRLLARVMDEITARMVLHELTTDLASYRVGERASLSVRITNFGRRRRSAVVSLLANGKTVAQASADLAPGQTRVVSATVPITPSLPDITRVRAEIRRDGVHTDTINSAFCVWNERIVRSGPRITWKGNYLTVDDRPTYLVGANQTGMMFYSPAENPAVWDRDFAGMARNNVHILRILHFSPYAKAGYEGEATHHPLDLVNRPEKLRRQMDAIVQIAMKHRVAIFLAPHDWLNLGLTDDELAAEADWNRFWADRFRMAPGMIFDIQNEPSVDVPDTPGITALWNRWLADRYGSDEALRAAWAVRPPEAALPNVPLNAPAGDWSDTRAADRKRFEAEVLNRWVKANVDGIRAGNPNAPICVGYLPFMAAADRVLGTRYTDFSNMHYYGSIANLPLETKMIDRRAYGKGLSLGEFGAQEAHDTRTRGETGLAIDESVRRYRLTVHYGLGLGAAFVEGWCWKDFDEMVFPWGMVHHGTPVPKPWLHDYGMSTLLASLAEPEYRAPQLYLLLPDRSRIGPRYEEMHGAIRRSIELLLDAGVDFALLNEEDLAQIPGGARALVWPLPYCPDDATFERVREWTAKGGALYLSGGVGFDATRQPTRAARYAVLGIQDGPMEAPFAEPEAAWNRELVETALGSGKVLFAPYPLELRSRAGDQGVYRRFLAMAGIEPTRLSAAAGSFRVMVTHTRGGGRIVTLVRTDAAPGLAPVTLPDARATVELAPQGCAFLLFGADSALLAAESDGRILVDGKVLASGPASYGVAALDGTDLRSSREVVVLAPRGGTVTLPGLAGVAGGVSCAGSMAGPWRSLPTSGARVRLEEGDLAIVAAPRSIAQARARLKARIEVRAAR